MTLQVAGLPDLGGPELLNGRAGEEPDHLEVLGAGVVEVVSLALGEHDDVAGAHRVGALVAQQLAAAGEDELGLLGGVGVAAEPLARRHGEVDHRRTRGSVAAVGEEATDPLRIVAGARGQLADLEAVLVLGIQLDLPSRSLISPTSSLRACSTR